MAAVGNKQHSTGPLAVLLGADRGKLRLVPTRQVDMKRLSFAAGEPVIFTVRALTGDEFQDAQDASMRITKRGEVEDMDTRAMQINCVLSGIKEPDLKSHELQEIYEASTPDELLDGRFLLPGEVTHLFTIIQDLSGFGEDAIEEIKN